MKKTWKRILILLADLLLAGMILCVFSYFHHIRYLWGLVETPTDENKVVFAPPPSVTVPEDGDDPSDDPENPDVEEPVVDDGYDRSGMFGEKFYDRFLKEDEELVSTDTEYRSKDISITLEEINTTLYYNNKTYKVQYFVYDIYVRNVQNFYSGYTVTREPLTDLIEGTAVDNNLGLMRDFAIAAVNGDYWGNANHTQVAVRNGVLLRKSDYIDSDILVMYYDGTMQTYSPEAYNYDEIVAKYPYQIWEFGPSLLDENGKALTTEDFDPSSYDGHVIGERNPRCGVGYYEPGHYCFVVVDGRSSDSDGMRMFQLADVFEELGCTLAYNMDGGDSSQAYFNGNDIRVDEERVQAGQEQRKLYDIICIGEVRKLENG